MTTHLETFVSSTEREVIIGASRPIVVIGEYINPTGRPGLTRSLQQGDMSRVQRDALAQVEAGAHILDINVGLPGQDQPALMMAAVRAVQQVTDVPLCLDSADINTLEAGLTTYQGKALVNSVTGEEEKLSRVLALIKQYGAAVIGLTMDDDGIPPTAEGRLRVAERIVNRAQAEGIPCEDVILDPLVMAVGAEAGAANMALDTIRLIRRQLGANVTLGVSNVSHGLPARSTLNATFVAMAIACGATCPILNPLDAQMMETIHAIDLCLGQDEWAARWIRAYRASQRRAASQDQ